MYNISSETHSNWLTAAIKTLLVMILLFVSTVLFSQVKTNRYGLTTLSEMNVYRQLIKADSMLKLVEIKKIIPGIRLDIRYATKNNFLREVIYKAPGAYLNLAAASALKLAEAELNRKGLGFKIYDAYRPYSITVLFYEKVKDTVFVASPYRGSRHNRGAAVDLTLIDLRTGEELAMPTGFDDFTEKAHTNYSNLPKEVIRNRELLKSIMVKYGFEVYPNEWWHYDFSAWRGYPLFDISFEALSAIE